MVEHRTNWSFDLTIDRDWEGAWCRSHHAGLEGVTVPWMVDCVILDEPDLSDPLNKLHVISIRIGRRLAFRLTMTAEAKESFETRKDLDSMMLSAVLMLGADYADEIRDTIAAVRAAERSAVLTATE
ncbi:MAG: hypothetical protein D4R58_01890 [Betaproteobacteria bacterium]|nr:MAG: hypothetical protein D4R58_01890 [Betaproteobacteria bacterium]